MGRYTSTQSFGDDKEKGKKITKLTYTEATGKEIVTKKEEKKPKLETERVTNPSGSVAGACSGDFHTYRHVRRREAQRLEKMEKDHREKVAREEHKQKQLDTKLEFERKAEKRRKKREKKKRRRDHAKLERELKKMKKGDGNVDEKKKNSTSSSVKVIPPPSLPIQTIEPPTNKNLFDNDGSFMAKFSKLA
jgi:hypothetical protein